MDPQIFQSGFPGELVATTGWEEYLDKSATRQTRQVDGMAFVPSPLPPEFSREEVLDVYGIAERALGELNGLTYDQSLSALLATPLLRNEARVSSKIENTIATAEEVMSYDAGRPEVKNDAIEVQNYYRALMHGLQSELPICKRLVCEMHAILMQNTRGGDQSPGEIRILQNRIGGSRDDFGSAKYVPPPPGEHLINCLDNLERFWNYGERDVPLLIAIAIGHYQFEAIHPFNDGNGRLGRAIAMLSLCKSGALKEPLLYLSGYFLKHQEEYYELLLRVSTHGAWVDWCRFFLSGIAEQASVSIQKSHSIRDVRQQTHEVIAAQNAPSKVNQLVDVLIQRPAIDASGIKELSIQLDVSEQTIRNYIQRLQEIGFLRESTGGKYDRFWLVPSILEIIDSD